MEPVSENTETEVISYLVLNQEKIKSDKFQSKIRKSIKGVHSKIERIEDDFHKVLEDFSPINPEELKMVKGETINILKKELTGWWFAENKETEEFGWVPANYLIGKHYHNLKNI